MHAERPMSSHGSPNAMGQIGTLHRRMPACKSKVVIDSSCILLPQQTPPRKALRPNAGYGPSDVLLSIASALTAEVKPRRTPAVEDKPQ